MLCRFPKAAQDAVEKLVREERVFVFLLASAIDGARLTRSSWSDDSVNCRTLFLDKLENLDSGRIQLVVVFFLEFVEEQRSTVDGVVRPRQSAFLPDELLDGTLRRLVESRLIETRLTSWLGLKSRASRALVSLTSSSNFHPRSCTRTQPLESRSSPLYF
ncbi:BQ5605_C018g08633 [Microbotryum silenes-dioicae]|uniref:BQ5605_C018g08633 protein n=1 Tax=Microbotryum silenes-dioicae TaxID=796604 RepID=A0A2X0LWM5_9BASI|nr:BQ5605_C018g08633 [Microbotryum silenes-dioicae]